MDRPQLFTNAKHRGVQAETRFHRDHHQVESVSESPRDPQLATRDQAIENESREQEAGAKSKQRGQQRVIQRRANSVQTNRISVGKKSIESNCVTR
jgi:hypothetical protein